ncbi:gag-pol polyprotein [Tanacetum coccineum]
MEKSPRLADPSTKGVQAVGIQTISKSISRSMMVNWIQMNSWSGYEQWNGQGTGTAEEYSCEFKYLLMKCDVPEDDPQTLVYSQQQSKGKLDPTCQSFRPTTYSKPTSTYKTTTPTNSHPSMISNPKSEPSKAPHRCFRCQGLGHIASKCTNKCMISLADFELAGGFEFESNLVASLESPHDDEVKLTGPDKGPCLVVRRTLSTTPVPETELQR